MRSLMCCQAVEEGGMEKKKPNITNISVPFFFFFYKSLSNERSLHSFIFFSWSCSAPVILK